MIGNHANGVCDTESATQINGMRWFLVPKSGSVADRVEDKALMFRSGRRAFLTSSIAGFSALTLNSRLYAASQELQWFDVRDWGLEGRGFTDTESFYDRFPARAKGIVPDAVWGLSRHSAGMMVRFRTDATQIHADYAVTSSRLAMPHMPATGVSGLDLYGQDIDDHWKWIAVTRPESQEMNVPLVSGLTAGQRDYAVYLPLYNGTQHLKIGVPEGTRFEPIPPRTEKPIVFYGTSITHGACASRPGMPHPAILGRRLNRPVINLGFSGSGRMESTVGQFLAELDPAVYVIDCLPNMAAAQITERTVPLVRQLRAAHPKVPIVLVEDRSYSNSWILENQKQRNETSRAAFKEQYHQLLDAGVDLLHYIDGESLLGADRDDTTDGSHPSDLGFFRHADAFEPVLQLALNGNSNA